MNWRESWAKRLTPEKLAEMEAGQRIHRADGAWRTAQGVRKRTVDALQEVAGLTLTRDEAKRSANQVKKLRKELEEIEAELRKAAE